MDISKERNKIAEVADRLMKIKNDSDVVKDYLLIARELRRIKMLMEKMDTDTIIYKTRMEYRIILENTLNTFLEDDNVKKYIETFEEITDMLNYTSSSMQKLRESNPELNAWIALNQKRAYFEEKLFEDPSNYKIQEQLEAVKNAIEAFKKLHKGPVEQWEEYYKLRHSISSIK